MNPRRAEPFFMGIHVPANLRQRAEFTTVASFNRTSAGGVERTRDSSRVRECTTLAGRNDMFAEVQLRVPGSESSCGLRPIVRFSDQRKFTQSHEPVSVA